MKHYLITEWNVDMLDLDWLRERQAFFEKFTLPSVQAQTNKDFTWVLVSDSRTPDEFKEVLDGYPAEVFYFDFENYDWQAPQYEGGAGTIMQRSIDLEMIDRPLIEYIGLQDTDYVITSRLDNDDAIANDHIERVQTEAAKRWNGKRFWLDFVRGLKYSHGFVYPVNSPHSAFISFVEPPTNLRTTYQTCHTIAQETEFPVHGVRKGEPSWLQHIHGGNIMNRLKRVAGKAPFRTVADRFTLNL